MKIAAAFYIHDGFERGNEFERFFCCSHVNSVYHWFSCHQAAWSYQLVIEAINEHIGMCVCVLIKKIFNFWIPQTPCVWMECRQNAFFLCAKHISNKMSHDQFRWLQAPQSSAALAWRSLEFLYYVTHATTHAAYSQKTFLLYSKVLARAQLWLFD